MNYPPAELRVSFKLEVISVFNSLSLESDSLACSASFRLSSRTRRSFSLDFASVASRGRASTPDALIYLGFWVRARFSPSASLAPWSIPDWLGEASGFPPGTFTAVGAIGPF